MVERVDMLTGIFDIIKSIGDFFVAIGNFITSAFKFFESAIRLIVFSFGTASLGLNNSILPAAILTSVGICITFAIIVKFIGQRS